MVELHKPDGGLIERLQLPAIGTAAGFGGERKDTETFFQFSNFVTPGTIYRLDLATRQGGAVSRAEAEVRSGGVRDEAGLLHEQGRDAGADVRDGKEGDQAGRAESDAAVCVWRLQHLADAGVQRGPAVVDGDGRGLCAGEPARRRRVRRGVARGRDEAEEAECVRRLHRGGGVADCEQVHVARRSWRSTAEATAGC